MRYNVNNDAYLSSHTVLGRNASNLPLIAQVAVSFADLVMILAERHKTRKQLRKLPPHLLRDVGITRTMSVEEAQKPFWRA